MVSSGSHTTYRGAKSLDDTDQEWLTVQPKGESRARLLSPLVGHRFTLTVNLCSVAAMVCTYRLTVRCLVCYFSLTVCVPFGYN